MCGPSIEAKDGGYGDDDPKWSLFQSDLYPLRIKFLGHAFHKGFFSLCASWHRGYSLVKKTARWFPSWLMISKWSSYFYGWNHSRICPRMVWGKLTGTGPNLAGNAQVSCQFFLQPSQTSFISQYLVQSSLKYSQNLSRTSKITNMSQTYIQNIPRHRPNITLKSLFSVPKKSPNSPWTPQRARSPRAVPCPPPRGNGCGRRSWGPAPPRRGTWLGGFDRFFLPPKWRMNGFNWIF
jgi:hypothetical protein